MINDKVCFLFTQPLHHAARGEHVNVIRFLLSSGALPTIKNSYGKVNILKHFCIFGSRSLLDLLIVRVVIMQIPGELADVNTDARRILEAAAIGNSLSS